MTAKQIVINGKTYPLWSQFVADKDKWIGGKMYEVDLFISTDTEITDITLTPNGDDSAMFTVHGKDYSCGFDVHYGGIGGGTKDGWLQFIRTYSGHFFIKEKP